MQWYRKTKALVWLPLVDGEGALFPKITAYLDGLEELGIPIVLMRSKLRHLYT